MVITTGSLTLNHTNTDLTLGSPLSDAIMNHFARHAGMDVGTFEEFLKFLAQDQEIMERFTVWRTKRRLTE